MFLAFSLNKTYSRNPEKLLMIDQRWDSMRVVTTKRYLLKHQSMTQVKINH